MSKTFSSATNTRLEIVTKKKKVRAKTDCNAEEFLNFVRQELVRARKKFPKSHGAMTALTEEVGELAKALLDEPWINVYQEAVQVAVMACRVAVEGDPTLKAVRKKRFIKTAFTKPLRIVERHHKFKTGKTFPDACVICNVKKEYHA